MKLSELMEVTKLEEYISKGLVSKRKHPKYDIYILNYTAATQFDWLWDEVTLNCRGLVVDGDYNIVARSLPKFFSYEQLNGKLPEGEFVVEEKMDGSMLLVFNYQGEILTATRGSFESEQALKGKELFADKFIPNVGETWIFEVIYNQNKIVVNYDWEGLALLAVVYLDGTEVPSKNLTVVAKSDGFISPKVYSFNSLEEILKHEEPNLEGFVLHYESGERVKIKLEEYKRLHRLITGFNEKDVWEALKEDKLEQVLEEVPDEMYDWVKEVESDLTSKFNDIKIDAMSNMKDLGNRKDNALYYQTCKYPALMFYLLDGKDVEPLIWKMVKPKVTQTFKLVAEESN
jgi:RNA ligase